jgi:hypothetical protein
MRPCWVCFGWSCIGYRPNSWKVRDAEVSAGPQVVAVDPIVGVIDLVIIESPLIPDGTAAIACDRILSCLASGIGGQVFTVDYGTIIAHIWYADRGTRPYIFYSAFISTQKGKIMDVQMSLQFRKVFAC